MDSPATAPIPPNATDAVRVAGVTLWPPECLVVIDGQRLWLTRREFQVLEALARSTGHVVPKPDLFHRVWGRRRFRARERSVDVYVRKLRLRLREVAPQRDYIHTHRSLGYRFEPTDKEPT